MGIQIRIQFEIRYMATEPLPMMLRQHYPNLKNVSLSHYKNVPSPERAHRAREWGCGLQR